MRKYISNMINKDDFQEIAKIKGLDLSTFVDEKERYLSFDKKVELYQFVMSFFNDIKDIAQFFKENKQFSLNTLSDLRFFLTKK